MNVQKIYYNGKIMDADADISMFQSIYEVIRIKNGKPLFLYEHIDRLKESCNLSERFSSRTYRNLNYIVKIIEDIIKINDIQNQNIRVDIDVSDVLVRPVQSYYPVDYYYEQGVDTVSMNYIRSTPNAKVSNVVLFERTEELRRIENVFEVLLVNDEKLILEGSRSNIFFVRGTDVYTPPNEAVLSGVTRNAVLKIFGAMPEITLHYEAIPIGEVYKYDCCFLTGTSIDLLPVRRIDSQLFDSASNVYYLRALMEYRGLCNNSN